MNRLRRDGVSSASALRFHHDQAAHLNLENELPLLTLE